MIRIARLDLERWGHFEERRIAFGPAGRLHVLFGGNEAGKSTTRRAVSALLFGVKERPQDLHGRAGSDLRVGALLEVDGAPLEVVRRKGRKDTLLDPDGGVLDPAPLEQALGGLNGDVYRGLFEITHDSLVQGGHELLEGRGAVGESLFAAAAGTSRLHALLRRLEGEADAIFTPLGRKKDLNVLLTAHGEALRTLRDAGLRPPQFEQLARELQALEAAHAEAGAALDEVERERKRLERLRGALPLAALRATRLRELEALGDVVVLGADATARRVAAEARRDEAAARARAAARDLARRTERHAALAVDEALLAFADELEALNATRTVVAQDAGRRDELAGLQARLAPQLEELLTSLVPALGDRSLRELAIDEDARARLEACLQARAGVEQAVVAARDARDETARAAERAARATDAAAAVADPGPLQATVRAARAAGAIDELIARAAAERARALDAAGHATARMRPAPESASALAALPVPDGATVERVLGAVVEAAQTAAGLETEDEAIADRVRALEHQRDRLVVDARVPDAAALAAARARRAAAWAAARAELVEPTDRTEAEAHALAEAVEGTTADADATADARLAHAEEVARLADLERELSVLSHDADELSLRRERHETTVAQAAEAWQTAWAETGPAAPAPEGAAAWLAARETALGQLADADDAAERLAGAEAVRDQHADALRGALADAGAAAPAGRVPLATLLELADARAETLRAEADRHDRAAETVGRTAAEADDAEAALAHAEAAAARWEADWTGLRDGCGLAPTLAADDALGALRRLAQAAQIQDEHARVTGELEAIDARRAAFTSAVAELLRAAAPDLADQPAATAVSVLHRRATEARAAAAERDALAAELTTLEAEQAEAGAIAAEAEEQLAVLRAAAGAEDDAALVRCEQVSAQAEALRAEILQLDGDLARAGGAPADEVAAAVAELDADAAPARAEALDALAAARRDARDQAGEALLRARDELAALERSEDAAMARQESATLLAQVRQTAERYARARLAQKLLRDAIERYRSDHEGPLLARANVLFPALTCERFAQLKTELDEHDEHVLVAVTRDGARRRVEELSDGTREQLFLALRLAAIERHVAASGPVPVLFDDVLLESDDDRAMRILDALADLAGQTQVIVLTHHRHLVDLARCTIAAERLDLLELDERATLEAENEAFGDTGVTTGGEAEDAGVLDEDAPDEREPRATPTLADELAALTAGGGRPPAPGEQSSLL